MQLCEIPSGDPETPQSVTEDCCWYSYCTTILCRTYIRVYQRVNCSAWPHIQWFRGICRNAGPFRLQDWSPPIRWLIFQDSSGKGKGLGPCSPCGAHRWGAKYVTVCSFTSPLWHQELPREAVCYLDICINILGQTPSLFILLKSPVELMEEFTP